MLVSLADPRRLWDAFRVQMSEDFLHRRRTAQANFDLPFSEEDEQLALHNISDILTANGKSYEVDCRTLPALADAPAAAGSRPYVVQMELEYDRALLAARVAANVALLTAEQAAIYNDILAAVDAVNRPDYVPVAQVYFIHAGGGCGKTFLVSLVLDTVRSRGKIALATATCGVAALLLEGGCTAHHRFKLGIDLDDDSRCGMAPSTPDGQLMAE
jgi:hypothetical protein